MRTIAATAYTTGTEDAYDSWKDAAGLGRDISIGANFQDAVFVEGAAVRLSELEAHKEELKRYIRKMEEADREDQRNLSRMQ